VLVPPERHKASNNVTVVAKKYYLEVVLKEIDATTSNELVTEE
jgi:hypothetical protein